MTSEDAVGPASEVDLVAAIRAVEHQRLDERMAVWHAEEVLAAAALDELAETGKAARRQLAAARGVPTKARRDGSADKIRTAHDRVEAAAVRFDQVDTQARARGHTIEQARRQSMVGALRQVVQTLEADIAADRNTTPADTAQPVEEDQP